MKGLSTQIESAIDSVIKGLNFDIRLDQPISDFEDFKNFIDYNTLVTSKGGAKYKGKLTNAEDNYIEITYYVKKGKEREATIKKVYHKNIKDAKVYEDEGDLIKDDKMSSVIDSKVSSFKLAKDMLNKWSNSKNAPTKEKLRSYVLKLDKAGDNALDFLKTALGHEIDYEELDPTKFALAIKSKPLIMNAVFELESSLNELKVQIEDDKFNFIEKEFKVGYPERYAKGEFYPIENYYKDWYNEEEDAVRICPFSTDGEIITLSGLKIQLPKKPRKDKILFSDLPKKEQYWRRQEVPKNITPDNQELFNEYILEEFRRRREGIWFMNNGEAVYLTGNMYFALQWCQMFDNRDYMDFRYAQLHMFYHLEACILDPRCFGQIFLKSRRTGFTYAVLAILMNMSTATCNGKYGMTSKSGTDVQEVWEKYSYMFLALPFYFRPVVRGKEDSPSELYFGKPSNNSKEAKKARDTGVMDYLNTVIDHRPTLNGSYDSVKLNGYLGDEAYKWTKPNDYIVHLGMIKPTMVPNGTVVGKAFIGSTMGAMNQGGEQGVELIKASQVEDRDPVTQQTPTGLYFHFLAAQDNMEKYTDKYGKCWTEKPPKGTLNVMGKPILEGSLDYLLATEEQKRRQSDKALNEQYRTYPRTIEHALRDESEECVFNMVKLYEQIEHNNDIPEESRYMIGNFEWKEGVKDSDVEFRQMENGRFKVSWLPSKVDGTEHLQNRVRETNGKFYPLNKDVIRFGCDPFSLKSTHGEGSKGGLHGKTLIFPEGGAPSNKFAVEYIARPPDEVIFFEDVIKCIRFYGAPILVESNRIDLLRHMRNRGYRGFAMNRLDRPESALNENEKTYGGQLMSSKDMLDSHMNSIGSWIQNYVGVYMDEEKKIRPVGEMGDMPFNETLKDWLNFNPDKRTKYDATISSGLAIMACQTEKYKGKTKEKKKIDIRSMFTVYENKGDISTVFKAK